MKKLLYLLPFLFLNFAFSYGEIDLRINITDRIFLGYGDKIFYQDPTYKDQFCSYEMTSEIEKSSLYRFSGENGFYGVGYGTPPNLSFYNGDKIYENLGSITDTCGDGLGECIYWHSKTYEPVVNCNSYKNGVCVSGTRVCIWCQRDEGKYFNSDTGECESNCDLIPNLEFRSDCQCKKAGLGNFVKSYSVIDIINDNNGGDTGGSCIVECQNRNLTLEENFCFINDKVNTNDDDENTGGDNGGDNNDNSGSNNNDKNNTGDYDYCKTHPDICYPDKNNTNPDKNNTGGNGGGSPGGGNNGGNNNDNSDTSNDNPVTPPNNGDDPSGNPSDDSSPDGECKGENCTPQDITTDYKKLLDDSQKQFDGAYNDTKNKIDGLIDTAKSAINDIKSGGFINFNRSRITTCPVKSDLIDFGFFSYRFEYDLCEWFSRLYGVFYFLTLCTCLFFGLKWILSHLFNIGGSE